MGAWRLKYGQVRRALEGGYYQGWDLHPAELPVRYAATYAFFLEGVDAAAARLRSFVERAAQATVAGTVFDDAATGQGLLGFFLRAIGAGAMTEGEAAERTGLTPDELRGRPFRPSWRAGARDTRAPRMDRTAGGPSGEEDR